MVEGYPDRILPKDEAAAKELKKRTLTNLYNTRPAWLDHAHRALDEAVAEAYGWGDDYRAGTLTDDEILIKLEVYEALQELSEYQDDDLGKPASKKTKSPARRGDADVGPAARPKRRRVGGSKKGSKQ